MQAGITDQIATRPVASVPHTLRLPKLGPLKVLIDDSRDVICSIVGACAHRERRGALAALWPKMVEIYGPYAQYQAKTDRQIPVVILEPVRG